MKRRVSIADVWKSMLLLLCTTSTTTSAFLGQIHHFGDEYTYANQHFEESQDAYSIFFQYSEFLPRSSFRPARDPTQLYQRCHMRTWPLQPGPRSPPPLARDIRVERALDALNYVLAKDGQKLEAMRRAAQGQVQPGVLWVLPYQKVVIGHIGIPSNNGSSSSAVCHHEYMVLGG